MVVYLNENDLRGLLDMMIQRFPESLILHKVRSTAKFSFTENGNLHGEGVANLYLKDGKVLRVAWIYDPSMDKTKHPDGFEVVEKEILDPSRTVPAF
jgi:hypothetical protein